MIDLFGERIPDKPSPPMDGYAAKPGSGPKGKRCNSCRFIVYKKADAICDMRLTAKQNPINPVSPSCYLWQGRP